MSDPPSLPSSETTANSNREYSERLSSSAVHAVLLQDNATFSTSPRRATDTGSADAGSAKAECLGLVQRGSQSKWGAAGGKVIAANKVSSKFDTLRDQKQVNELDPSRLKLVKVLGEGAFATVNLCELLPALQLNRSFSLPAYPDKKSPAQVGETATKDRHQAKHKSGGGQLVAVKCLKGDTSMPVDDLNSFVQEAALTRKLKHKYIVDYVGIGFMDPTSEGSMFIAQEYMAGGTLKAMVFKQMLSPNRTIYTDKQALQWSLQLAEALAYLHSAIPMVIHRDLKLENVLLTSEEQTPGGKVAKLADFGLVAFVRKESARKRHPSTAPARLQTNSVSWGMQEEQRDLKECTQAAMQHMGTFERSSNSLRTLKSFGRASSKKSGSSSVNTSKTSRLRASMIDPPKQLSGQTGSYMYMSPEMFKSEAYNEKVDVFSFGVMMYELFHRFPMVCAISNAGTKEEVIGYARQISNGYRPPIGERWPPEFRKLLTDCLAQNAKDRPAMSEVAERLKVMLKEGTLDSAHASTSTCCVVS